MPPRPRTAAAAGSPTVSVTHNPSGDDRLKRPTMRHATFEARRSQPDTSSAPMGGEDEGPDRWGTLYCVARTQRPLSPAPHPSASNTPFAVNTPLTVKSRWNPSGPSEV